MSIAYGGTTTQGQPIGILMLDTKFPRIIGDVGNGFTYDFPVKYHTVKGASPSRVVIEKDPMLLQPFIDGVKKLEEEGCQAVATSCGFLIMFQKELAAAVNIPVATSGLLQVPFVSQMLAPDKKIGILTANSNTLDERHFKAGRINHDDIAIQGMQEFREFYSSFVDGKTQYDIKKVESEVVAAAQKLIKENPNVGAIVCECTNMAPFSPEVNRATGLPVFDVVTLIRFISMGVLRGMTNNFRNQLA